MGSTGFPGAGLFAHLGSRMGSRGKASGQVSPRRKQSHFPPHISTWTCWKLKPCGFHRDAPAINTPTKETNPEARDIKYSSKVNCKIHEPTQPTSTKRTFSSPKKQKEENPATKTSVIKGITSQEHAENTAALQNRHSTESARRGNRRGHAGIWGIPEVTPQCATPAVHRCATNEDRAPMPGCNQTPFGVQALHAQQTAQSFRELGPEPQLPRLSTQHYLQRPRLLLIPPLPPSQ